MGTGVLKENPVKGVPRPKEEKRLPQFYRKDALEEYCCARLPEEYPQLRDRLIVLLLYATGMRNIIFFKTKTSDTIEDETDVFSVLLPND